MQATYPFLFRDEGKWFRRIYMHGIVHVSYACECFDCKTREISISEKMVKS